MPQAARSAAEARNAVGHDELFVCVFIISTFVVAKPCVNRRGALKYPVWLTLELADSVRARSERRFGHADAKKVALVSGDQRGLNIHGCAAWCASPMPKFPELLTHASLCTHALLSLTIRSGYFGCLARCGRRELVARCCGSSANNPRRWCCAKPLTKCRRNLVASLHHVASVAFCNGTSQ